MRHLTLLVSGLALFSSLAWAGAYDKQLDKLAAECRAGKAKSCAKLADIAKHDKNGYKRDAAIKRITDQQVLVEIARTESTFARRLAVKNPNLTDQIVLAHIAKTDDDEVVRRSAVEKLTDQALLADIAEHDRSAYVRAAAARTQARVAVEKLTDETVLGDIAKNETNEWVREAAIKKLTDQAVLADIAKNAKDSNVRDIADKKLADQAKAAVERVTDQAALADMVKNDCNEWVRRAAVEKLTNQAKDAVEKLTDQAVLAEIAKSDGSQAWKAIEKLTDQSVLADVARANKDENRKGFAVKRIDDRTILAGLARDATGGWAVRLTAAGRLDDRVAAQAVYDEYTDFVKEQKTVGLCRDLSLSHFRFIFPADRPTVAKRAGVARLTADHPVSLDLSDRESAVCLPNHPYVYGGDRRIRVRYSAFSLAGPAATTTNSDWQSMSISLQPGEAYQLLGKALGPSAATVSLSPGSWGEWRD